MKYIASIILLTSSLFAAPVTVGPNGENLNQTPFLNALGGTTAGKNLFRMANPGAVRYLRINADNTVSTLDAAAFKSAIGAGGDLTSGPVTSSSGVSAIADAALSIAKTSGLQAALEGKVDDAQLSTTGGANKVLQFNADGHLQLGPYNNGNVFGGPGTLIIPDKRYIQFPDQNGNIDAYINNWGDHGSSTENELIVYSAGRMAFAAYRGLQMSPNDSARLTRYMEFNSGEATYTLNETLMPSMSAIFQTKAWNGSASIANHIALQAKPLDATGNNSILNIYDHATVIDSLTNDPTATRGDITGPLIAQIYKDGIWSNGTAPAFDTLTATANVFTQTCSKYKTVQSAKLTLGATNTLAISGVLAGMRGVIYVAQDATGGRLLTMPSGSCLPSDWVLSTLGNKIDRLSWEFDGVYYYWTIKAGLNAPLDSDASAFIAAAVLTDDAQKTAINNLVLELKANGFWAKPNIAFWPFVGGNATAHSKELKNVYNGSFPNGMTHSSDGITGNGTSHYFQSGYDFAAVSALNSASIYVYCKTASPTAGGSFAGAVGSGSMRAGIRNDSGSLGGYDINANSTLAVVTVSSDFRGHLALNRSASNAQQWGKNGLAGTNTIASSTTCDRDITFLARSFVGFSEDQFSNANLAFAMLGPSLTSGEWVTFRAIIDRFQTALGRQN